MSVFTDNIIQIDKREVTTMENHNNLSKNRNKISISLLAQAILVLILGIALVIQPYHTFHSMRAIGLVALGAFMLVQLLSYFISSADDSDSHFALIFAAVAIAIVIIRNPYIGFSSLMIFISVLFLYQAGKLLEISLSQRSLGNKFYWINLISAVILLGMGVYAILNPVQIQMAMQPTLVRTLAIFLILLGLINIVAMVINTIGTKEDPADAHQENSNYNIYQ